MPKSTDDTVAGGDGPKGTDLPIFPGEHPQQHAAREWLEGAKDIINECGLQPVLANERPHRVRGKKLAKKAFEAKAAKLKAEEAAKNNKRIASLKASFDVFDKDKSGKLGSDEVLEILTRMTGGEEPLTEEDAIEFIKEFDRDGDGEISVDEFILAMGVVSDAVDHDGDGKADKGESKYDGEEEKFAEDLVKGDIGGKVHIKAGAVAEGVEDARRMQKA